MDFPHTSPFSLKGQKILIIAPHPDDEVIGCGGLIHRCKKEGAEVYVLFLTVGESADFSQKGKSTMNERIEEMERVAEFLKIDGYRLAFPGNDYHLRLDALPQKDLIHEIERGKDISLHAIEPSIVLTPLSNDYNQDHRAASLAMTTALRPSPPTFKSIPTLVLDYELPGSAWTDRADMLVMNFFVELAEEDHQAKMDALSLYKSQLKDPRATLSLHGISTLAQMRGLHCGMQYAEAYFAKRSVVPVCSQTIAQS